MVRPRFTLTRIALAGAGLLTVAGIGAATIPAALASTPAAATSTTSPATTTPKAPPAPGAKGKAKARHLGLQLRKLLVEQTATQTGQTVKQVRTELRSGKSLDAIAGSKAQAVRDAVLDTVTKRLDALRAEGTITQAQETRILGRMRTRITKVMEAVPHHKAAAAA